MSCKVSIEDVSESPRLTTGLKKPWRDILPREGFRANRALERFRAQMTSKMAVEMLFPLERLIAVFATQSTRFAVHLVNGLGRSCGGVERINSLRRQTLGLGEARVSKMTHLVPVIPGDPRLSFRCGGGQLRDTRFSLTAGQNQADSELNHAVASHGGSRRILFHAW